MNSPELEALLLERMELQREKAELRDRMLELTAKIDAMIDAERGNQLLNQLSDRDRALLTQTIRAKGIESEESVNGKRTVR